MAFEELCKYCFEDMDGESVCPHCGRDSRAAVPEVQLLPGTLVYRDRFLLGRALGQDSTGIVYAAYDTKKGNKIRIREYMPRDCARRLSDGSVVPVAGKEDAFDNGLARLRASVESVEDPRKRHFYFEQNGTGYIAQRKQASAAAAAEAAEEKAPDTNTRKIALIAAVAAVVVIAAAAAIIAMMNGAVSTSQDISTNPTINADAIWIPEETPTVTPNPTATFAALVDPDLSWMDYSLENSDTANNTATPKPTATPKVDISNTDKYGTVSTKSDSQTVRSLQQKLVSLGWLSANNITGTYDAATKQAVKDFQSYVNEHLFPSKPLDVDGIAGKQTQLWLYEYGPSRPSATPTPMVRVEKHSDTISNGSPVESVRVVQRYLIELGLLEKGSDDGKYGSATVKAVQAFQKRVNQLQGYEALEVTGEVDELTMAYLSFYADEWQNRVRNTPKPTKKPTPTPTLKPTPTPVVVEIPQDETIKGGSPKSDVRNVQRLLNAIGMMEEDDIDGLYGSGTIAAVAEFQEWVNAKRGEQTLDVTGECDMLTLKYLQYCDEHNMYPRGVIVPTEKPTPTPKPTAKPTEAATIEPVKPQDEPDESGSGDYVGPDSEKESIKFVQQMLQDMELLSGKADGVFGKGTKAAVEKFQKWVNENEEENVLKITGECDSSTLRWMERYTDRGMTYGDPEPEDDPDEPTGRTVTEVYMQIGDMNVDGMDLIEVYSQKFRISWSSDGDADCYYFTVRDSKGNTIVSESAISNDYVNVSASKLKRGEVYTVSVGALPTDGMEADIVWKSAKMVIPSENAEPEDEYLPEEEPEGYTDVVNESYDEPVDEPAEEPVEEPDEEEVYEDPAEEDQGEPEQAVQIGVIQSVSLNVSGAEKKDGVAQVSGSCTFSWSAEGDVESYTIQLLQAGVMLKEASDTQKTSLSVSAKDLKKDTVYTLRVGAQPVNGTAREIVWRDIDFARATAEKASGIEGFEISLSGSTAELDGEIYMTGSSLTVNWSADNAQMYCVYLTTPSGTRVGGTTTTDTSRTVDISGLKAGQYTVHVGAIPEGGTSDDAEWITRSFRIASRGDNEETPEDNGEEVPSEESFGENGELELLEAVEDYGGEPLEDEFERDGVDWTEPVE